MPSTSSRLHPVLRIDAAANRARILAAARELFAAHGLDVPMSAIARRAGVGVATLYRRFPTRDDLVTAAFTDEISTCAGLLDRALADPDPWRAFCRVLTEVSAMQARDQGFSAAFLTAYPHAPHFAQLRDRTENGLAELVRRAQESGDLRPDFDPADIVLVLQAVRGVRLSTPAATAAASHRLVAYLLQSFRAGAARPLPPPVTIPLERALG